MADRIDPPGRNGLFAELRRRNVLRAGAFYVAVAWALAQGIAQLGAFVGLPDWAVRWFLVAAAVGFPFWIAFAWFYEFTPQGLKRESEVAPDDSITHHTGRKLDYWIIGVLAVAVVLLITNTFVLRRDATSVAAKADAKTIAAELAKVPQKSVAVLPFANESGDPKQQYFSDGLSEELITDLTGISDLKVIGKYSSFQFRDSKESPAEIGAALGVAHLIEGSVRQSGGELRITVNLIRAKDGSSVWSERYDRPLKDVFAIQDEIGKAVATAMQVKLAGTTLVDLQKPPSGNVEAYRLMLQGRVLARRQTKSDTGNGIELLEQAVQLDPGFAYAWAVLANARINLAINYLGGDTRQQAIAQARADLDRATALAPDAAFVHVVRGYLRSKVDHDPAGALKESQRALALAPNDGAVMMFLALALDNVGQLQQAVDMLRAAIATDPLRAQWHLTLAGPLTRLGHFDEAEQAVRKAVALQPRNPGNYIFLSQTLAASGKFGAAEDAARKAVALQPDDPANSLQLAAILDARGRTDEAIRILRKALAAQPDYPGAHARLAVLEIRRGDAAGALREARMESDPDQEAYAVAMAQQVGPDRAVADATLREYLNRYGKQQPDYVTIAEMYTLRKQPDEMFQWLQRGVAARDYVTIASLLQDSLLFPYHHDPRFAALCRQLGLPVPGETPPASASVPVAAASTP